MTVSPSSLTTIIYFTQGDVEAAGMDEVADSSQEAGRGSPKKQSTPAGGKINRNPYQADQVVVDRVVNAIAGHSSSSREAQRWSEVARPLRQGGRIWPAPQCKHPTPGGRLHGARSIYRRHHESNVVIPPGNCKNFPAFIFPNELEHLGSGSTVWFAIQQAGLRIF